MVVAILLSLITIPVAVMALESDMRKPINITSDRMDIDDGSGKSVYRGNVRLQQGSLSLRAGTLTVIQSPGKGKSSKVIAEGRPAVLRQIKDGSKEKIEGRANRLEYTVNSKLLVMTGNASLKQGGETFKSDRIVYDRAKAAIKAGTSAKGKERVRVTIGKGKP
jgi:lipopolysaccharide export system protein LptA